MLMNWPPSKGPEPEWLKPPELIVPEVKRVLVPRSQREPDEGRDIVEAANQIADDFKDALEGEDAREDSPVKTFSFADLQRETEEQAKWDLRVMCQVEAVASIELHAARQLLVAVDKKRIFQTHLPTRTYGVVIDYPLSVDVSLTIPPLIVKSRRGKERQEQSVPYLLWVIARAYVDVYEHWEEYGVWGHALSDLWFEGLRIDGEELSVDIGS